MSIMAKCRLCGDIIKAKYGHNMVKCTCGAIALDDIGCDRYGKIGKDENFLPVNDSELEMFNSYPEEVKTKH